MVVYYRYRVYNIFIESFRLGFEILNKNFVSILNVLSLCLSPPLCSQEVQFYKTMSEILSTNFKYSEKQNINTFSKNKHI